MYTPREDSFLLEKYVNKLAKGKVLDMGTGSGIQAISAAKNKNVSEVIAVDIDDEAIKNLNKNIKNKKIRFITSNLFSNVHGKFNTIIFNPPYLPQDNNVNDKTLYGGKKGYELIERFFKEVRNYMNPKCRILIVFSSLTNKSKINEIIKKNGFEYKLLEKQHIFFEDLFVYLVT